jgi:predicted ABC-type exoprotein transport system permease subunit
MLIPTVSDLLLLPGLLTFFGALLYGLAWLNWRSNAVLPNYRWVAVILALLALFIGVKTMLTMSDPFYRTAIAPEGRKIVFSHYLAPALPVLLLLTIAVMEGVVKRRRLRDY